MTARLQRGPGFHGTQDPAAKTNRYILRGTDKTACFLPCGLTGEVPSDADLLILNGCRPDGEQKLRQVLETHPDITVAGSSAILAFIRELLGKSFSQRVLKDGDSIELGGAEGAYAYFRDHIRPFKARAAKALALLESLDIDRFYPEMGEPVAAGISRSPGVKAELLNADGREPKEVMELLLKADGIAFGILTKRRIPPPSRQRIEGS